MNLVKQTRSNRLRVHHQTILEQKQNSLDLIIQPSAISLTLPVVQGWCNSVSVNIIMSQQQFFYFKSSIYSGIGILVAIYFTRCTPGKWVITLLNDISGSFHFPNLAVWWFSFWRMWSLQHPSRGRVMQPHKSRNQYASYYKQS